MFEIGRVCVKTAGREAGRFCTVVAKDKDKDFLIVTGPKEATCVRRRKCNFRHLEPTPFKVEIKENATDEDVLKAYEKDDIFSKLRIPKPGEAPAERKHKEEPKEERREEKAEKQEKEERMEEKKETKDEARHEKKEEHKEHKHKAGHEHKGEKPKKARAKKAASKKAKKKE